MERYSRQILFPPIRDTGQMKIAGSTVLVVGAGALGTVISSHLVRAGIGKLILADRDYVEMSNLQRQMLFDETDVKEVLPKAVAAKRKLERINSDVQIEAIVDHVSSKNIYALAEGADIVLDGTDNFQTRYLLNDICFMKGIPFSYGGVVSSRGMSALFIPGLTPCLRCMIKEGAGAGQTCDTAGVIAPAVDIVSSLQVTEALKYITGNLANLRNTLRTFDIWFNQQYDIRLTNADPDCVTCRHAVYPSLQKQAADNETVMCGRNTVQIHEKQHMNLEEWQARLAPVAAVDRTPFLLKARFKEGMHIVLFPDGRVLIQGTEDRIKARTFYDRYVGS